MITKNKFEIFLDASYYDMWCLRKIGCKDLDCTLHFYTQEDAQDALQFVVDLSNLGSDRSMRVESVDSVYTVVASNGSSLPEVSGGNRGAIHAVSVILDWIR